MARQAATGEGGKKKVLRKRKRILRLSLRRKSVRRRAKRKKAKRPTETWSDPEFLKSLSARADEVLFELRLGSSPWPKRAEAVDDLLVRIAKGQSCINLAIGALLVPMFEGDRLLRVGLASRADYARVVLDSSLRSAQEMVQMAKAMPSRPLLRTAVEGGEISWRKALTIVSVAKGESEAAWVELALRESVRTLRKMVKAAGGRLDDEEVFCTEMLRLTPTERAVIDEAERLARLELGADKPRYRCMEAIAQEYLGTFGGPRARVSVSANEDGDERDDGDEAAERKTAKWAAAWHEHVKEITRLREESRRKEEKDGNMSARPGDPGAPRFGDDRVGVEGGEQDRNMSAPPPNRDPHELTARIKELVAIRKKWDHIFGPLAWWMKTHSLWKLLRPRTYDSFTEYCTERLGLSVRVVSDRVRLERRLQLLPELRKVYESGLLCYSKAKAIARVAKPHDVARRIEEAISKPSLDVQRSARDEEDKNMSAQGKMRLCGPEDVMKTLRLAAERATELALKNEGITLTPSAALVRVAEHFVEIWSIHARPPRGRRARIFARCNGICEVPECSRAAHHLHHIISRALGGSNDDTNLVAVCAAHHLRAIHMARMRVRSKEKGVIVWEVGVEDIRSLKVYLARLGEDPVKVNGGARRAAS